MDNKELESMNLYDMHAKLLLLQSGILSFEDWRKDMVEWAHWYLEQEEKKGCKVNGTRRDREA